ncbi:hypothetical protein ABIE65_003385 [Constrictibacter sp. MBR-5]|uniref:hypothetical protein n=1 Tax=Constrictibacter sp. MBR-5 TaxID=3156467 RepID=UPI00339A7AE0
MAWSLIILFCLVCLTLLAYGLSSRERPLTYPFLAGATFLGFVAPQLPALMADRYLPAGAVDRTVAFTTLCAGACLFGWLAGSKPLQGLRWTFDEKRLLWLAAGLSLAGAFFFWKYSRLPDEVRLASMHSGISVIYIFFQKMLTFGLMVALVCFVRRPSRMAGAIVLFDMLLVADRIMVTGKRGELTEVVLGILLALWFQCRFTLPRVLLLAGVLVATVGLNSAEQYRNISKSTAGMDLSRVKEIDVIENFETLVKEGGPEVRNAALRMHYISIGGVFDFGIFHWNLLIHDFVPGQLVGRGLKDSLYIIVEGQVDRQYAPVQGSTETGMSDAFASFWYLGAIKFFLVAYVLGRLYATANLGWYLPQLLYIFGVMPGMTAITHYTQLVVAGWVHLAILLLPGLLLARVAKRRACVPVAQAAAAAP